VSAPSELDPERASARECGLELLEASTSYETIRLPAEQRLEAALIALVGRARGHLRAAYLLQDAGMTLEAGAGRRALVEYIVTVGWLLEDPGTHPMIWQRSDASRRLAADDDVRRAGYGAIMPPAMRQTTQDFFDSLTADLAAKGIEKPKMPKVEELARAYAFAYVPYRFDSQVATHPSMWAAEQLLSVEADGSLQLHPGPAGRAEQAQIETYGMCAYSLLTLLVMIDDALPEPMVGPGRLDAVRAKLDSLR
jgi:hypothetical protein